MLYLLNQLSFSLESIVDLKDIVFLDIEFIKNEFF
jgi:hypothetical protein